MKKIRILLFAYLLAQGSFAQHSSLESFIESFSEKNHFNGNVIVAKSGKIAYEKSFGLANVPFNVPTTPQTKYKIASITKAFTAVLVLQFYEARMIDLDKAIKIYLPDYKGEGGDKVSIRHLLTMTAGMANMDRGLTLESALTEGMPQYQRPYTTKQFLEKFCSDTLVNLPGKAFDYNNTDYIILGQVLEKVSGKPFGQLLSENILQPLGMSDSGLAFQYNIIENLADTYFFREDLDRLGNDLPVYIENWYAAGAMYSTARDILKFSNGLFSGKLLKPESLKLMFTSGIGEYGFGVWVYEKYEINKRMFTIVKRPGSIMGAQAMLFHVLEADITIIVLSNTANTSLDNFVAEIAKNIN